MVEKTKRKINDSKGFTLIELIVVIAIIGILMLLAVPRLIGYTEDAKLTADQQLSTLYKNTFNVMLGSGKLKTKGVDALTDKLLKITVSPDGATTAYSVGTSANLLFRKTDGKYVTGANDNVVAAGAATTADQTWADDAVTLATIQYRYISGGGNDAGTLPGFKSTTYSKGITITIDANDIVTVAPTV